MRKIEALLMFVFLLVFSFVIRKTYEAHTTPKTIERDAPTIIGEVVELSYPEEEPIREIPEVRFTSFEDEFAVKPLIRNLTEEDKELLRRIAQAESGNQDVIGRALVMLTVLNRVEKNGDTVRQTIYAPNQFYTKGMCNGDELTEEALELILSGWDESEGCIYFCSTGWNQYGSTHLFQHGDHYFSR